MNICGKFHFVSVFQESHHYFRVTQMRTYYTRRISRRSWRNKRPYTTTHRPDAEQSASLGNNLLLQRNKYQVDLKHYVNRSKVIVEISKQCQVTERLG